MELIFILKAIDAANQMDVGVPLTYSYMKRGLWKVWKQSNYQVESLNGILADVSIFLLHFYNFNIILIRELDSDSSPLIIIQVPNYQLKLCTTKLPTPHLYVLFILNLYLILFRPCTGQ